VTMKPPATGKGEHIESICYTLAWSSFILGILGAVLLSKIPEVGYDGKVSMQVSRELVFLWLAGGSELALLWYFLSAFGRALQWLEFIGINNTSMTKIGIEFPDVSDSRNTESSATATAKIVENDISGELKPISLKEIAAQEAEEAAKIEEEEEEEIKREAEDFKNLQDENKTFIYFFVAMIAIFFIIAMVSS